MCNPRLKEMLPYINVRAKYRTITKKGNIIIMYIRAKFRTITKKGLSAYIRAKFRSY